MKRLPDLLPLLIAILLVYVPFGGWRLLYGGPTEEDAVPLTYGAETPVPGFAWVTLLNWGGVSTSDGHLSFFDTCLIRYRGRVQEVTSHYSLYTTLSRDPLVEYTPPPGSVSAGVLCPQGALFLLPREELATYGERFAERQAYEGRLADAVNRAARQPASGPATPVSDDLRWVEAVNPAGLDSYGYRIDFLDACGIERGGTVQAVADTFAGTVYAYDPDPSVGFRGIGIPCPPKTLFLRTTQAPGPLASL